MNESKWAVRKIRKGGRVKIGGKWFHPEEVHMEYDGRLDGLVYLFGRYLNYKGEPYAPFVYLWGLAENSGKNPDEWIDDPQVVDGYYNWSWWKECEK